MRCIGCLIILAAALSAPWDLSGSDVTPIITPKALDDFIQQRGLGPAPLTKEEWCQLALLVPEANEQTRMAINDMARNRGCYTEAQSSKDEEVRAMICRKIAALIYEHVITNRKQLLI